jgi:3-hydroxyacyl-CoA dehydrogenase/enoyl-CoA hydratase/3-hydroxybutyryl-CoA epimerase
MVGAMAAAPCCWKARCSTRRRPRARLIDEVVPADDLLARAKEWVLSATDADIVKPWDQKGYKMPGGAPYHPAGFMTFVGRLAMINGKTKGVYPAAKALLSAVYEGALVDFDTALKDRGALVHLRPDEPLLLGDDPLALHQQGGAGEGREPPRRARPEGARRSASRRGHDGRGHRLCLGQCRDRGGADRPRQEAADKGKAYSEELLDKGMKRGKVTGEEGRGAWAASPPPPITPRSRAAT